MNEILDGIKEVIMDKHPGSIFVFGDKAFSFLAGKLDNSTMAVGAAAYYGKGKFAIFSHNKFLAIDDISKDQTKLVLNIVKWATKNNEEGIGSSSVNGSKPRAAVQEDKHTKTLRSFLKESDYDAEFVSKSTK